MKDRPIGSALSREKISPGIPAALGAALLFGASTPIAKALLSNVNAWLLAGLLYLGSGLGLATYRLGTGVPSRKQLAHGEWRWLAGAVVSGGVIAPVLLMFGLTHMDASCASLLLNAEGVFTALLAWFAFRENFDLRIAVGMAAIVVGTVVLSWSSELAAASWWPSLAVVAACLAWGLDNNLTRKVALAESTWVASIKGLAAGTTNLMLALVLTRNLTLPPVVSIAAALGVGCIAYGASLALYVVALRHLGTARTAAYFSIAPFFGAALSILFLHEQLTMQLLLAGALMAAGVWLHLSEHHAHWHTHVAQEHEHEHVHDEHHQHEHGIDQGSGTDSKHTHWHRHEPVSHQHAHYPDTHHRHPH